MRPWVLPLLLCACNSKSLATLDASDRDGHVLFAALIEQTEEEPILRDVLGPLVVVNGALEFEASIQTELQPGHEPLMIELPIEALGPALDRDRFAELELDTEVPPAAATDVAGVDSRRVTRRSALPEEARFFRVLEDGEEVDVGSDDPQVRFVRSASTLNTPVDPEYCRPPDQQELMPFGAEVNVIGDVANVDYGIGGIEQIHRFGDRAVLMTPTRLYLVRANDPPLNAPALPMQDGRMFDNRLLFPGRRIANQRFSVDPRPRADAKLRVIAAVREEIVRDVEFGLQLVELLVDESGFEVVSTASVADFNVNAIDLAEDGRMAVLDDRGRVLVAPPDVWNFEQSQIAEVTDAFSIAWTDDPEITLVASSQNQVHLRRGTVWSSSLIEANRAENTDFRRIVSVGSGADLQIWAASSTGVLAYWDGAEMVALDPALPPSFLACTNQSDGRPTLENQDLRDLVIYQGYVYIVVERCTAIVQLRIHDRCPSFLTLDGEIPKKTDRLLAIHHDGFITIGGKSGVLYTSYQQ